MILAIYKKNHAKDKHWSIASIAYDIAAAKKECKKIDDRAKRIGWDTAESIIQGFNSADDIPSTLTDVKSEDTLYN